jgi:hypothetical protein
MANHHPDYIKRRSSVLDRDQTEGEREGGARVASRRTNNRPFRKLIPFIILAVMAFLIAREEIPAVNSWWERMVSPENWLARQTCLNAAMERSEHKAFSRVLKTGKVNKTVDGLYIEQIVLGEMGSSGKEEAVRYSCYLDREGKLVKLNRLDPVQTSLPAPGAPEETE